jgi:hypothetical protein
MNTNQRIERTKRFQDMRSAISELDGDVYRLGEPAGLLITVADFVRRERHYRRLPAVFHRISRGWTARDWLIEHRAPSQDIPF